jgi:hypothetical protein
LLRKQHLFVVSALTSHQFCHNYAPANATSGTASIAKSTQPLKIAELSQSALAAMSARDQDHACRTRYEKDLNFMIALHDCARYLVWPRHHGQQKSTIVLIRVEDCALRNSWRSSVVTNSMIVRKTLHDELSPILRHDRRRRTGSWIPDTRKGPVRPLRCFAYVAARGAQGALCEGLVNLLPSRGASVACITQQQAEFIPLLGTIESHASELACIRTDAARITHIKKLHGQFAGKSSCRQRARATGR